MWDPSISSPRGGPRGTVSLCCASPARLSADARETRNMSSGALFTSTASVCHRAATSKGATPRMCAGLPGAGGARRSLLCPSLAVALGGKGCKTHAVKSGTSTRMTPLRVRCMANPRRVAKVQQQMRREISSMLQMDKVRVKRGGVTPLLYATQSAQDTRTKTLKPLSRPRR